MERLLNDLLSEKKVVVITGAGISTLSGIKPFRGKNGLYTEKDEKFAKDPMYYLSRSCLDDEPEVFYEFYKEKMMLGDFEPNIVHNVLSQLEKNGLIEGVITQNIDGLHQKSGSENTVDIHGDGTKFYCSECETNYTAEEYKNSNVCKHCGGVVRPDIVLYEEGYDSDKYKKCIELINSADVVLVLGTSLTVSTATNLLDRFIIKNRIMPKFRYGGGFYSGSVNFNKGIYIVNAEKTPYDCYATKFSSLKEVFERIQEELDKLALEKEEGKTRTRK